MKQINQGDIYMADLNPVKGHEQAGLRPVLILQSNVLNRNLSTVIIAPITSNLQTKGFLTTFYLNSSVSKLPEESVALLFQLRTLDKRRLKKEMGHVSSKEFSKVKMKLGRLF